MSETEQKLVFLNGYLSVYYSKDTVILEYQGKTDSNAVEQMRSRFEEIYGANSWDKVYPSLVIMQIVRNHQWMCSFPKETFAKALTEDENERIRFGL